MGCLRNQTMTEARPSTVGVTVAPGESRHAGARIAGPLVSLVVTLVVTLVFSLVAPLMLCAASRPASSSGPPRGAIDRARLEAAAEAAGRMPRLHSLLVSRRGELLLERYYNGARAARPANVKSVSKSVISALVGIAIERGLIRDVHQRVASYFPAHFLAGSAAAQQPPSANDLRRRITIEDLLTNRSGLEPTSNVNYGAWVQSRDWVRYALTRRLFAEPGTVMAYSTGNFHVLSAILTQVSKSSTWEFAQQSLARPLGFPLPRWPQDPQGIYFGGNDMLLTPRQMVAFGELYLNAGRGEPLAGGAETQVIPARWVAASLAPRVESRREAGRWYGYGWWLRELAGHRAFYAWGYGGQFIFVIPTLELVVVTTSSTSVGEERREHRATVYDLVEDMIIPAMAASTAGAARP
jgi:CubicO group peptidase (beta-lactamase class C family)